MIFLDPDNSLTF